jgi:hypothetical protein
MPLDTEKSTTVRISGETWARLANHGKFGETMDAVVNRILNRLEELEKVEGRVRKAEANR